MAAPHSLHTLLGQVFPDVNTFSLFYLSSRSPALSGLSHPQPLR